MYFLRIIRNENVILILITNALILTMLVIICAVLTSAAVRGN